MDKREYLISIGLAKPGRGRFSAEAEAAWKKYQEVEGHRFDYYVKDEPSVSDDEYDDLVKALPAYPLNPDSGYVDVELPFEEEEERKPDVAYLPELPRDQKRKENLAYSITKEGYMVAHTLCGTCNNHIQFCACQDGPDALGWVRKEVEQKPYLVEA